MRKMTGVRKPVSKSIFGKEGYLEKLELNAILKWLKICCILYVSVIKWMRKRKGKIEKKMRRQRERNLREKKRE